MGLVLGSVDNCAFGGTQLSGYVNGNVVAVRVYRSSTGEEFGADLTYNVGVGTFGEPLQAISEITLTETVSISSGLFLISSTRRSVATSLEL